MAVVRKLTIGVQPLFKMFRMNGQAGAVADALLRTRSKNSGAEHFSEIGFNEERTACRVSTEGQTTVIHVSEENIAFVKDYYDGNTSYDFRKVSHEFKAIWTLLSSVLDIRDIRRLGMVAEFRMEVPGNHPSVWLRENLTTSKSPLYTDKFQLSFSEREFATDGGIPDVKKSDFLNYNYKFYDGALDTDHPSRDHVDADLDVQRYFTPVLNGNVGDELIKLNRHFEVAQKKLSEFLKVLGATHAKR